MAETLSVDIIIVLAIIITFLFALIVGYFIGKSKGKSTTAQELEKVEQEFKHYKETVSCHFGKTADLIDNLTHCYKEVFDHLSSSAKELLTDEQLNQHIQSRENKTVTLTYLSNEDNSIISKTIKEQETREKGIELLAEVAEKVTEINDKR